MARGQEVVDLLERIAACQDSSAEILRARGRHAEAQQAETSACRIRLSLDEPDVTSRMYALARALPAAADDTVLYEQAVDGALALFEADFGNVRVADPDSGALRPAAGQRFASSRVAPNEAFLAMLSTRLIDPSGRLRAVVSIHFCDPRRLTARDQLLVDWYGERVAIAVARAATVPLTRGQALGALHDRAAARHLGSAARHDRSAQLLEFDGERVRAAAKREWAQDELGRGLRELDRAHAVRALDDPLWTGGYERSPAAI